MAEITGTEMKAMRMELGLSTYELGRVLGISDTNASRVVRGWETGSPSGPAALALIFIRMGMIPASIPAAVAAAGGQADAALPDDVGGEDAARAIYARMVQHFTAALIAKARGTPE